MIGTNHKARVEQLIEYYGEPITLSYTTVGIFDPTTGSYTTSITTDVSVKGYITSYTTEEIDDSVVISSDTKLYISDITEVPDVGWTCTIGTKKYRVLSVKPRKKGGQVTHYVCQLRV